MKLFILLCMIFCHIIDDYYLQGILASMKQKSWWKNNYPDKRKSRGYFDENGMHVVWLSSIKDNLIRGGKIIDCSVTLEDLYKVLQKQNFKCAYTGIDLQVVDTPKGESNASVDRIDSDKGYEIGNVQWVYKPINIMKNGLSDSDFKNLCCKVADFTRQS